LPSTAGPRARLSANAMTLPHTLPAPPVENDVLPLPAPNEALLAHMALRRSTKIAHLTGPGPDEPTLAAILRLAARVPDHGKIAPWRIIVLEGAGRRAYGEALAALVAARKPETDAGLLAFEAARFERCGVCVAVVSKPVLHPKVPEWEQVLSSGAVCMNMLHAAWGFGFAGCWLTEWPAYDREAMALLGLSPDERITGFVYLGQASEPPLERPRPDLAALITHFPA